jgi:hypothetical protein
VLLPVVKFKVEHRIINFELTFWCAGKNSGKHLYFEVIWIYYESVLVFLNVVKLVSVGDWLF